MRRRAFVLLNRTVNRVVLRLGVQRFRGANVLYLTTTGRKTGQSRTVPLAYVPEPAGQGWIVAASNGGADWEPGWWLNLQAAGSGVVEVDGRTHPVRGEELDGAEREDGWRRLHEQLAVYDGYQRKVRRRIAVVRLMPTDAPPT